MTVCLKAKVEAKAWFARRWFLSHPHQKGKRSHGLLAGKSCSKCCWQTSCLLMVNNLELEERQISPVDLGKEGTRNRGKISFPILLSPSEDWEINVFWGRDTWRHSSYSIPWSSMMKFLLVHLPLTIIPKNSQCELKPEDFRESYFLTESQMSHILPYLTLHKWSRENGVMWLLYGNLNEKYGCWHAFLNMWYSKILFCRTVSKGWCRTKEAQALIWDNDGQEVAGGAEKIWVL